MEWEPDQATSDLIRHLALQNSLQYSGEGQAGSVISRIMGNRADLRQFGKFIAPLVAKAVAKANAFAASDGLDAITEILEREAPELLERKVQTRREGLPDEGRRCGRISLQCLTARKFRNHERALLVCSALKTSSE